MVECNLPKVDMGVRFSLPAPKNLALILIMFTLIFPLGLFAEGIYSPPGIFHKIKTGQTLWGIAQAYGVDILELMRLNRLSEPSLIYAGRYLFIPGVKDSLNISESKPDYLEDYKGKDFYFIWPVRGKIVSFFGLHGGRRRNGIEIACPRYSEIKSAEKGEVVSSGLLRGYGHIIIVDHHNGYYTIYAHNHLNLSSRGKIVEKGERIALAGSTGRADEPGLYFEIRKGARALDPLTYLPP